MITLDGIAARVARYLAAETQLDAKDTEVVCFGLESFLGAVVGIAVATGVAWWWGITPYVLAALGTSIMLRLVSGGAHCSTFLRCLVLSTAVVAGIGKLAALIAAPQAVLFSVLACCVAGGCYAIYRWVPADTPARPIVSLIQRARYRRLAYSFLTIWAAGVSFVIMLNTPLASGLAFASIGGGGWQFFSITPAGYRLVAGLDTLANKICTAFQTKKTPV